jgi:hypothetical protein
MQPHTPKPAPPATRHFIVSIILCSILILTLYVWIVSRGTWTQWPTRTTYYDQQAASFAHGQLALAAKPNAALLTLSDPYVPANRANIPFPLDVSLYGGKFYLYFGPVPALLLLLPKTLVRGPIGDQYLVFLFGFGIFICLSLLIIKLWKRYFLDIPPWMVILGILLAGLVAPLDAILNGSSIYDAAITGGQFFFLAGWYWALDTLDPQSISKWKLAMTGLLWGAALGCRITLILPIGLMALMVILALIRNSLQDRSLAGSIPPVVSFALPLLLCLIALGWYNWARFGSALETGISYQLAGPNLEKHRQDIFSSSYIVQNLYNYVFNAPERQPAFPYVAFAPGKVKPVRSFVSLPHIYDAERMTGTRYTAPFLLFALIPAVVALLRMPPRDSFPIRWITAGLYGSFLSEFVFFMAFFWAAERYLLDFLPSLLLLSIIGFWQLSRSFDGTRVGRILYAACGIGLAAFSMIVSTLLAIGNSPLH